MKQIKKIINFIYFLFFYDRAMVGDLCQYYNLSKKDVFWLLVNGKRLNNILWNIERPITSNDKNAFYQKTPFYVFELLAWHMLPYQKKFREGVKNVSKGKVLDYGAGPGDLCLEIYKKGLKVDYTDVAGQTFNFAKWLFKKNNASIKMIDLLKDNITEKYDTILCIDVIEHLSNAKEIIKNFSEYLNSNGVLIVTNLNVQGSTEDHPMHEKVFIEERFMQNIGFKKTDKPWMFIKE